MSLAKLERAGFWMAERVGEGVGERVAEGWVRGMGTGMGLRRCWATCGVSGGLAQRLDGGGPAVALCAAAWASLLPTLAGLGTLWLLQPQLASPH